MRALAVGELHALGEPAHPHLRAGREQLHQTQVRAPLDQLQRIGRREEAGDQHGGAFRGVGQGVGLLVVADELEAVDVGERGLALVVGHQHGHGFGAHGAGG